MRLTGLVLVISAVLALGSGPSLAAPLSREELSFLKVIASSKAKIARLYRLNASLEDQKDSLALRLSLAEASSASRLAQFKSLEKDKAALQADNAEQHKLNADLEKQKSACAAKLVQAETDNNTRRARLASLEKDRAAVEASVAACRQEIMSLKAKLRDAERMNVQASRELKAYRIVRSALDVRTKELGAQTVAADRAQEARRDAQLKLVSVTKERLALQEENAELHRRINIVTDNVDREKAAVYREVGAAYTDADMLREAIFAYNEAIRFDPKNPKAHYALGVLYAASGSSDKAVRHLKQYLWLTPYASNKKEVEYLIRTVATHKGQD